MPNLFWEDDPFQKENEYDLGANQVPLVEAQKIILGMVPVRKGLLKC